MPSFSGFLYHTSSQLGNINAKLSVLVGQPEILANRLITRTLMRMPWQAKITMAMYRPSVTKALRELRKRKEVQVWRVFNAVAKSATIFARKAQEKAPKRTGFLANSIVPIAGYLRENPNWFEGQAVCTAPYAIYVEQGTKRWHRRIYPRRAKALLFEPVVGQRIGYHVIKRGKNAGKLKIKRGQKIYAGDPGIGESYGPIFRKWVSGQKGQFFMKKAFNAVKKNIYNRIMFAAKPRIVEDAIVGHVPALPFISATRHRMTRTARFIRNVMPIAKVSPKGFAQRYARRYWTRRVVSKLIIRRRRGRS